MNEREEEGAAEAEALSAETADKKSAAAATGLRIGDGWRGWAALVKNNPAAAVAGLCGGKN